MYLCTLMYEWIGLVNPLYLRLLIRHCKITWCKPQLFNFPNKAIHSSDRSSYTLHVWDCGCVYLRVKCLYLYAYRYLCILSMHIKYPHLCKYITDLIPYVTRPTKIELVGTYYTPSHNELFLSFCNIIK